MLRQALTAINASDIFARTELIRKFGNATAASTPMIMVTIMISTMVNPAWLLLLRTRRTVSSCFDSSLGRKHSAESPVWGASAVPDCLPSGKPLISIIKQVEFQCKRIPAGCSPPAQPDRPYSPYPAPQYTGPHHRSVLLFVDGQAQSTLVNDCWISNLGEERQMDNVICRTVTAACFALFTAAACAQGEAFQPARAQAAAALT